MECEILGDKCCVSARVLIPNAEMVTAKLLDMIDERASLNTGTGARWIGNP